uniref:Uncharacterized protein n=1 Tax=Anguilla anguilla TaxID=7936 RepID=A0A0E9XEJ5_ANGAN
MEDQCMTSLFCLPRISNEVKNCAN